MPVQSSSSISHSYIHTSQIIIIPPNTQSTPQYTPSIHQFAYTDGHTSTTAIMEQFEFHPASSHPLRSWTTIDAGVTQMVLNEDPATGRRTTLQRWEAGAQNAQAHAFVHDYVEEIYLAEGDLYDTRLGQGWQKGAYAYRKPGMEHGPFRSETGCLMFIVMIPVDKQGLEKQGD